MERHDLVGIHRLLGRWCAVVSKGTKRFVFAPSEWTERPVRLPCRFPKTHELQREGFLTQTALEPRFVLDGNFKGPLRSNHSSSFST